MNNKELINKVIKSIKSKELNYKILNYLKASGMDKDEAKLFIEKAKIEQNKRSRIEYPKKNKKLFYIFGIISIFTFIIAIFVIPYQNIIYTTIVGIILSIVFVVFGILSWFSRNNSKITTEELEKIDFSQPNNYSDMITIVAVISSIPCVIFYFIFAWQIGKGQDYLLKTQGIKTKARIIDGESATYGGRRKVTYTDVTVKFYDEDKNIIVAKEDISEYELKSFYKNQVIEIMYLPSNPQNIVLLTNKSNKKQFLESAERNITPQDLFNLFEVDNNKISKNLNTINYGWKYNLEKQVFVNESNESIISKKDNTILYITKEYIPKRFEKYFKDSGYKYEDVNTSKHPFSIDKVFENNYYNINLSTAIINKSDISYSVLIYKK